MVKAGKNTGEDRGLCQRLGGTLRHLFCAVFPEICGKKRKDPERGGAGRRQTWELSLS